MAGRPVESVLHKWWIQPDHYGWMSGYFKDRGLQRPLRYLNASTTTFLGPVPLLRLWDSHGTAGTLLMTGAMVVTIWALAMSLLWITRWPTRRQSARFAMGAALCIAANSVISPDPVVGLVTFTAFAGLGCYVAFLHTARVMTFTLVIAVLAAATLSVRLAAEGRTFVAASSVAIAVIVVVSVSLAGQILVQLLGSDLKASDNDPLTGLFNRRALNRLALDMLETPAGRECDHHVVVTMIDLDNFKALNDTRGHAEGDRALVSVGRVIRESTQSSAIVARAGGEEFLVLDVLAESRVAFAGDRIRAAIAATSHGITASVGIASTASRSLDSAAAQRLLDHLIEIADQAMYSAKRHGGNQIRHTQS
jgi:diguanylate cyclase (GGDEF)-like protein